MKKPHSYILASYRTEASRKPFCGVCAKTKATDARVKVMAEGKLALVTSHQTTSLIDSLLPNSSFLL